MMMGGWKLCFPRRQALAKLTGGSVRVAGRCWSALPTRHSSSSFLTTQLANLTQDDQQEIRTQLRTQGFAVTPVPLLDPATMQALHTRYEALFRGEFETGVYPDEWHWRQGLSLPGVTREICNAYKADRLVASVVLHAALAGVVAQIQGWSSVRIGQDDVIWKPPRAADYNSRTTSDAPSATQAATSPPTTTTVGFHRDSDYISKQFHPYENSSLTLWIALDDADEETGCIEYVPGSQRQQHWKEDPRGKSLSFFSAPDGPSSATNRLQQEESHRRSLPADVAATTPIVRVPCPAGHAILHHQDVWHGSGPNQSTTRHRRALVAHYLNGQVQWKVEEKRLPPTTTTGTQPSNGPLEAPSPPWQTSTYIYGRYRRSGTVELDEDFFPILYASPESDRTRTAWVDAHVAGV
jgi:phytanoyl-CoA hydroxylase